LSGEESSVDIATEKNLKRLVEIGTALLKKPLSRVNLDTGRFEKSEGEGTYEDALVDFAKQLVEGRKLRQNN
jgi:hypothetical protein